MIRNTPATLEDFRKSSYWEDIVDEINIRIGMRHEEIEDPDGNLDISMIYRMQGAIKAYKEVRDNLLDSLIAMSSEERT
jgi:hypothetical protein